MRAPANLSGSRKAVNQSSAWVDDVLTYDIWLANGGELDTGLLTLSDAIPDRTAFVSGSLTWSSGNAAYDGAANAIAWSGVVTAGGQVHISYSVLVESTPGVPYSVVNTAQVDGPDEDLHALSDLMASTLVQNQVGVDLQSDQSRQASSGETVVYQHVLTNTGNAADTFTVDASSSQAWTVVAPEPLTLGAGVTATVQIAIQVPSSVISGTVDTTVITATSTTSTTFAAAVTDQTTVLVSDHKVYLPIVVRNQ